MIFTKIRLVGLTNVDLTMIGALPSDPYILKEADGLGMPETDVSISRTMNQGGVYQGRQSQTREFVFRVGLNPNYGANQTVSDLRETLYTLLSPGLSELIAVQIMNGNTVVATCTGVVKRIVPVYFTTDPEVQITIESPDAFLTGVPAIAATTTATGLPTVKTNFVLANGSAPAGFDMTITFTAALASGFTLTKGSGVLAKKMFINYSFASGDILQIITIPGSRAIYVTRAGTKTSIVYALDTASTWIMMHAGNNTFTTSSQAFTWTQLNYTKQYWGV